MTAPADPAPKIRLLPGHRKSPKSHKCTKWCSLKCMCGKTIHVEVKP